VENEVGCLDGETCNRNGCDGIMSEQYQEGGCTCFISPPCGYCTGMIYECDTCGEETEPAW